MLQSVDTLHKCGADGLHPPLLSPLKFGVDLLPERTEETAGEKGRYQTTEILESTKTFFFLESASYPVKIKATLRSLLTIQFIQFTERPL